MATEEDNFRAAVNSILREFGVDAAREFLLKRRGYSVGEADLYIDDLHNKQERSNIIYGGKATIAKKPPIDLEPLIVETERMPFIQSPKEGFLYKLFKRFNG